MHAAADGAQDFRDWAHAVRVPLNAQSLAALIGNARIIALAEPVHGAEGPLQLRNGLFAHLVATRRLNAIALETGFIEARAAADFIEQRTHDLETARRQGLSWTFDRLTANADLLRWMREYNTTNTVQRLKFFGFDMPGSPGEPRAVRGPPTALEFALASLDLTMPAERALHERLTRFLPALRFDPDAPARPGTYGTLMLAERDELTRELHTLRSLLAKAKPTALPTPPTRPRANDTRAPRREAQRAAHAALDIDAWLRAVTTTAATTTAAATTTTASDTTAATAAAASASTVAVARSSAYARASDLRDRAQATYLERILEDLGAEQRLLLFAHNQHLATAPLRSTFTGFEHTPMGTYVRAAHGRELLTIGALAAHGTIIGESLGPEALPAPAANALDAIACTPDTGPYVLDLRTAPAPVRTWLTARRALGTGLYACELAVAQAFDVLVVFDRLTPARMS